MNLISEFLEHFGIKVEQPHTPALPPGMMLEKVKTASAIARIFNSDAARQKSESYFFNDGTGPARPDRPRFLPAPGVRPKYMQGPAGRLPYFPVSDHLR
jgi:hypothetical protein